MIIYKASRMAWAMSPPSDWELPAGQSLHHRKPSTSLYGTTVQITNSLLWGDTPEVPWEVVSKDGHS